MGRRIAVFCDGTWNSTQSALPTNVELLSDIVAPNGRDKVEQVTLYFPGVGTGGRIDKFFGGAMGSGLDAILTEIYSEVAAMYRPGDSLYLFGFSRGAYTARSLVGLLRNCGLPEPRRRAQIRSAINHYRDRDPSSEPDTDASLAFRQRFSPGFHTSEKDRLTRKGTSAPIQIAYLGIWDTIGALGIPNFFLCSGLFNRRYRFHDTNLSSMVASARHAVGIDERRQTYEPALWTNLDALNACPPDAAAPDGEPAYQQRWFPGDHGSIGGGGPIRGLAAAAMHWVAEGAERQKLEFDGAGRSRFLKQCWPDAPLDCDPGFRGVSKGATTLFRYRDRRGPLRFEDISDQAVMRWKSSASPAARDVVRYRPGALGRHIDRLDRPPEAPSKA
ncbi:DUF2235 domain-containing protein [Frigidibacter sp. MR17.14]|uniref:DUF2235 domain-containing protein n=1 Tax=Frigidibacter sp. MR17.14 TaxID=3126509 RepID=UPI0030130D43